MTGLISDKDEDNYRHEIENIVSWCDNNNLFLNVSKTKEMIIDFKNNKSNIQPIIINNTEVEQVEVFKFLGIYLTNQLTWHFNCTEILKNQNNAYTFLGF